MVPILRDCPTHQLLILNSCILTGMRSPSAVKAPSAAQVYRKALILGVTTVLRWMSATRN